MKKRKKWLLEKNLRILRWIILGSVFDLSAKVFYINTNQDPSTPNPSTSTLRGALLSAGDGDTITFLSPYVITLTNPLPVITKTILIQGDGATIDGGGNYQIFSVAMGTLSIQDLYLNNGLSRGGDGGSTPNNPNGASGGGGGAGGGGALHVHYGATAELARISFSNNKAQGGNGGLGSLGTAFGAGGGGGGGGFGSSCSFSGHTGHGGAGTNAPKQSQGKASGGGGGGGHTAGGVGGTADVSSPGTGGVSGVILGGGGGGGGGYEPNLNTKPQDGALAYNPLYPGSGPQSYPGGVHLTANGTAGGGAGAGGAGMPGTTTTGGAGGIGIGSGATLYGGGFGGGGGGGGGVQSPGGNFFENGGAGQGAGGGGGGGGVSGGGTNSTQGNGGAGGPLGGGGGGAGLGASSTAGAHGGNGGFGGGGGGGGRSGGTSMFGGGRGGSSSGGTPSGGGGAAMGGAIFVQSGGNLKFLDSPVGGFGTGNTVVGGSPGGGGGNAGAGGAYGPDLFLRSGGTMQFDNSTNWTFSPNIVSNQGVGGDSGGGLIIGSGPSVFGTTILSGTNSYTGSTQINGGTLSVSADVNLGASTTNVFINNQGVLQITNSFSTARVLTLSGIATINVDNTRTFTVNSAITGTGVLTKIGQGTLSLGASPTYSGGTVVGQGTFSLASSVVMPVGKNLTVGTTYSSGAIFDMSGAGVNQTIGDLSGSSYGSIVLGNNQLIFGTSSSTSFSGSISGGASGAIQKVGLGTVSLLGSSSYTGGTVLAAGGLAISGNSSLGNSSSPVSVTGSSTLQLLNSSITLANPISINASQTLTLYTDFNPTISGAISGSGAVIKSGSGDLFLTSATNSYTGGTTIQTGTLSLENSGILSSTGAVNVQTGATFDISLTTVLDQTIGALTGSGSVNLGSNASQVLTFGNGVSSSFTFSGGISGAGSIEKTGTGTAIFTGSNSYASATTITQGTLSLQGLDPTLPPAATVDVKAGATFDISGSLSPTQTIGQLEGDAGSFVTLGSNRLIFGSNTVPTMFSGTIQGTGSILKEGVGTVTLAGSNSYTGGTIIQEGTLALAGGSSLSSSGPLIIGTADTITSATFDISAANNQSVGTLSGTTLGVIELGNNELTIGGGALATDITTFPGTIIDTGSGSIGKDGLGTVVLSGTNTYAGGTFLIQGTLEITNSSSLGSGLLTVQGSSTLNIAQTFTFSNLITIDAGQVLTVATDFSPTISSAISESASSGALLKSGIGTLILTSGSNSYTGGTTIQEGTLELGVGGALAATGAVTVGTNLTQTSAIFDIRLATSPVTIGDLSGSSLGTVMLSDSSAETLIFGTNTPTTTFAGVIEGALGSVVKEGIGTAIFSGPNLYADGTTINNGILSLQGSGTLLATGDVTVNSPGTFDIGAPGSISPQTIANLIGSGNVTLGGNQLQFGSATNATFSGSISGSGSIFKQGSGTAFFSGVNTFTGLAEIFQGTLSLTGASSLVLAAPSGVQVDASSVLDISASVSPSQQIGDLLGSGSVTLGSNQLLFGTTRNAIFSGVISGSGSVEKQGAGTATFTNVNTYQGGTTISGGTLALSGSGSLYTSGSVDLTGSGATFDISGGSSQTIGDLLGVSNTSVQLGSNQLSFGTANNVAFGGSIQGAGSILKQGTGIETFTGSSNFTGGTIIVDGTLSLGVGGQLSLSGPVTVGPFAGAETPIFDIGAGSDQTIGDLIGNNVNGQVTLGSNRLTFGTANNTTFAGSISGGGSILKRGLGKITLTGSNSFTGGTVIQGGTVSLGAPSGSLAATGSVTVGTSLITSAIFDISSSPTNQTIGDLLGTKTGVVRLGPNQLTFGTANTATFGGIIIGSGSIVKQNSGTSIFTGISTYQGSTTVAGGILQLQSIGSLLNSSDVIVQNGATLNLYGSGGLFYGLTGVNFDNSQLQVDSGGTFDISLGRNQTISNLVGGGSVLLGAKTLKLGSGNGTPQVFSGSISGSGSLVKQKSGTQVFEGSNSYTGGTTITGGVLALALGGSLSSTGSVNIQSGTFDISAASSSETIGPLTGTASGLVALGSNQLTFGNGTSLTSLSVFPGMVSGTSGSSLQKTGLGTALFSGSSTLGTTTIQQGLFVLTGSLSSAVTVGSNGILAGTGQINGAVSVQNGGIIKPGNLVGTLHITGSLNLAGSSHTLIELRAQTNSHPTGSSLIDVQGTATLGGNVELFANPGFYPDNISYTILQATPVAGTFGSASYAPGSQDLGAINVLYPGGSPNLVVISFGIIPRRNIDTHCLIDNPNGLNLANYLNQFVSDPILGPVLFDLAQLSCGDVNRAINSISPARNAIGRFVSENAMFLIASTVSCRMSQQRFAMRDVQMAANTYSSESLSSNSAKLAYGSLARLPEAPSLASFQDSLMWAKAPMQEEEFAFLDEETVASSPYGSAQTFLREENRFAFWAQGLLEYMAQDAQNDVPGFSSMTGGGLLGCDYYGREQGLLGAAVCYAKSSAHQEWAAGSNRIDYYAATLYGTAYLEDAYLEVGLAGAVNRFANKRFISYPEVEGGSFAATAKSSCWGGQVVPHVALGYDLNFSWGTLEPFVSIDCAMLFQPSFSEEGASPLNMEQQSSFSQILRSEAGVHFYQLFCSPLGDFVLRESLSYVNKEPFQVGLIQANVVGYPPGFFVDSFTTNESLVSPGLQLFYRSESGGFGSLSYIGEFQLGSANYFSNSVLFKLGCYF